MVLCHPVLGKGGGDKMLSVVRPVSPRQPGCKEEYGGDGCMVGDAKQEMGRSNVTSCRTVPPGAQVKADLRILQGWTGVGAAVAFIN